MILAVDMGNTNIVVGVIDNKKIIFSTRIGTDRNKTEMEFYIQLKSIFEAFNINPLNIEGGILSSVVPELTNQVSKAMNFLLKKKISILGQGVKTGLNIKIDNPQSLGADIVADAVGALEIYKFPLIVIDMGTATTVSIIDDKRDYLGGMIIPGIKTSMDALSSHASQLPYISLEEPKNIIGKNTIECMKSGLINGNVAMIDGIIDKLEEELKLNFTVVATGGLSKLIVNNCRHKIQYEEHLLLYGLEYLYNKNK